MTNIEFINELRGVAKLAKPEGDGVAYGLAGCCILAAKRIEALLVEIETLKTNG